MNKSSVTLEEHLDDTCHYATVRVNLEVPPIPAHEVIENPLREVGDSKLERCGSIEHPGVKYDRPGDGPARAAGSVVHASFQQHSGGFSNSGIPQWRYPGTGMDNR